MSPPDTSSAVLTEIERRILRGILHVIEVIVALALLLEALGTKRIPEFLRRQDELAVPATPFHLGLNQNQRCVPTGLHCDFCPTSSSSNQQQNETVAER